MKRFKSVIAGITASVIIFASAYCGFIGISATAEDCIAYIDFGESYAASVQDSDMWKYYSTDENSRVSRVGERIEFNETTNVGNSSGDRSVLLANSFNDKKIASKGKYKVVFDVIATDDMFKNLSSQFIFANTNWSEISGIAKITDKLSGLTVENKTASGGNTVYTLSKTFAAPTLDGNCNLLLSIYGGGSGSKYYLDNVYIYAAKEYTIALADNTVIGSIFGIPNSDIAPDIAVSEFSKTGYDFTVTPEKYPADTDTKIIISYKAKENLSCYVDFGNEYAKTDPNNYVPSNDTFAVLEEQKIKFNACDSTIPFVDRAVLLTNDYSKSTVVPGQKYRITLNLITSGKITDHTLQLKFGSSLTGSISEASASFDGTVLESGIISENKLPNGNTSYIINLDLTVPETGIGDGSKNILASICGSKQCFIDTAVIRKFFTYNVKDTSGKKIGTIIGFAGDNIAEAIVGSEFIKEDYICTPTTDVFPQKSTEVVTLRYTEITNILEYIDFGSSYAANHRTSGVPGWQYTGGATSYVKYSDKQILFDGQINSGKSYGDRAVLLTNDRTTTDIKAGRRYQLQFDLLLKNETLESKTVDIRFGSQVWDSSSYLLSKASELQLVKTEYSDPYNVYTLAVTLVAPSDKNILLSIYGNGASGNSILKNVYIFEEFGFKCIDEQGDPVGTLYAFPGEDVTGLLKGSEVDKRGFFESALVSAAPTKPSGKITIHYETDVSFVSFIDFSSVYAATNTTKHIVNSTSGSPNIMTLDKDAENISFMSNAKDSAYPFRSRSFVLANDYQSSGIEAGKEYLITFDLTTNSDFDISKYNFGFKSGRYAGNGLSSSSEVIYTGSDILDSVVAEKTNASEKTYTIALSYKVEATGWGSYAERNILMSLFGGANACTIDNIEISRASRVKLNNTNMKDLVGRIGYGFSLPEKTVKKNHTFIGWYADTEFTTPFTADKFGETDIEAYAYFKEVDTTANMDFTAAPPAAAKLKNFTYSVADGNIFAKTDKSGTAYLNMYNNSNLIQLSPANYYPVTFKYKTSGYSGKIKILLVSASKNSFDKAKNIIAATTVSASKSFASGSLCATPDILTENGVKGDYLYFAVSYDKSSGGKVFIDDIVLTQKTTVVFNTMGGNSIDSLSGEPGEEFTLPTPSKSGANFTGWYYDKSLKTKENSAVICYPTATNSITLYASWDKGDSAITDESFENYSGDEIRNNPNGSAKQVFFLSNSFAKTGNTSMRYNFDPETTKSITHQLSTFKLKGNSGNSGNGITVNKDTVYVLSFYVYAKKLDTTLDFTAFTANGDSVLKNGVQATASVGNARISPKFFPQNEWKKVYYVFKSGQKVDGADELYLSVRANSASVYTDIYIDDVNVEPLAENMGAIGYNTAVYSTTLVQLEYNYMVGKVGNTVSFPKAYRENYLLENWYNDYRYTKEADKAFESGVKSVYPQWDISGTIKVSLENVSDYQQDGTGTSIPNRFTNHGGGQVVLNQQSSDGAAAYMYDGSVNRNWEKVFALKETDGSPLRLVDGNSYVILVDIYLERYGGDFGFNFCTASQDNYYAWNGSNTGSIIVNADTPTGVWITTALTISASFLQPGGFNLYLRHNAGSGDTRVYFDNFRISSIDPNNPTIIINKGLIAGSVDIISGKIGEPYQLPKDVQVDGYDFCGWYSSPALTRPVDDEGIFFETMTVYAKMLPKEFKNNFENSSYNFSETNGGDMDYEIYDKNDAGHSAENVYEGDKSLHRIGNDYQHKNALIVRKNATLYPGEPYEISMWVKMDSYDHTNGAIKIASCSSKTFAWDLVGDMQAIVPIADLTDGQWHYITYNFMASAYYLALQTPGYCSIYIDDITIKHLQNFGALTEISYNEYVPIEKGPDGKIPVIEEPDPEIITDSSLDKYEEYQKLLDEYNDYPDENNETPANENQAPSEDGEVQNGDNNSNADNGNTGAENEEPQSDNRATQNDNISNLDSFEDDEFDDTSDQNGYVIKVKSKNANSNNVKRIKKKKTTVTQKRNPLTFKDILTGNSYAWYTIAFYSGVGAVILLGGGIPMLIILLKKKKRKSKISGGEAQ